MYKCRSHPALTVRPDKFDKLKVGALQKKLLRHATEADVVVVVVVVTFVKFGV